MAAFSLLAPVQDFRKSSGSFAIFAAIRRASSPRAAAKKSPNRLVLGLVSGCEGGSNPQREYSLGDLCEDSVAQRRQEVGFLRPIHNEKEAAVSSTDQGTGVDCAPVIPDSLWAKLQCVSESPQI
jgi:hypothetical protein